MKSPPKVSRCVRLDDDAGGARHGLRKRHDLMLTSRVPDLSPLSLSKVLINEERVADVQGEIEGPGTRTHTSSRNGTAQARPFGHAVM